MSSSDEDEDELPTSQLGSKEYWESTYSEELDNYEDNGDVGEIWFGEDIMLKMVACVNKYCTTGKNSPIVDIGCGNGMTLLELARQDYSNLLGIDYSQKAITLCQNLFAKQDCQKVEFKVHDMLTSNTTTPLRLHDLCLDKGTYDAVSLIPTMEQTLARNTYLANVHGILVQNGLFILASCNWTSAELVKHSDKWFTLVEILKTPQFNFGGKTGNVVSLVVLRKI